MKIKPTFNIQHSTSNSEGLRAGRVRPFDVERWALNVECFPSLQPSAFSRQPSRRGVALIITVILLAVVTIMALAFLAMSKRERGAVTTTTDSATARLAADDALAAAEAQIVANTLATTNPYNFGLLASSNYVNPVGFNPNETGYNPTNVNYDYTTAPGPLSQIDLLRNLANLYYLPRPPVFYRTNSNPNLPLDFRFYLDLNRNDRDDANGLVPEIGQNGGFIHPNGTEDGDNANVVTNFHIGDPDWIGVLQHPDQPYGPDNPFVARYAFIALPIGNSLDLNHIYNQVMDPVKAGGSSSFAVNGIGAPFGLGLDGFMRNQGVGSWEINLAAFLADLNTNVWLPYVPPSPLYYFYRYGNNYPYRNRGLAFDDARALLAYRYNNDYATLRRANVLFQFPAVGDTLPYDNIDEYSDGPLQTTPAPINEFSIPGNRDHTTWAWAGAPSTNHYFSVDDLFNPAKTAEGIAAGTTNFSDRLTAGGKGLSTYDRYTYYRLLSQMGVESAPEQYKINLNYSNAAAYFDEYGVATNISYYPDAETNLTLWRPLQFFTIAADKMLREYSREWLMENPSNYLATYLMETNISTANDPLLDPTNIPIPFGLSDIPVVISNRFVYTPAIQRVLQLAANMYDATTNNGSSTSPDFPSVFRPIFLVTNNFDSGYRDVYICGYEPVEYDGRMGAVSGPSDPQLNLPVDVNNLSAGSGAAGAWEIYTNVNVYGVPWIIGAKKGLPNFNEFAMESTFQLTRKLQVTRPNTNSPISDYQYNQMYNLSLTNQLGVECWNSYTNAYNSPDGTPRSVAMYVYCTNSYMLTNDEGCSYVTNFAISHYLQIPNSTNSMWPGYNPTLNPLGSLASFQIPLYTNMAVIPTAMYRFNVAGNVEEPGHSGPYVTTNVDYPWGDSLFESGMTGYPQPHWWLTTSNNVRVIILDTTVPNDYRVLDYVQLRGPNGQRDLTSEILKEWDSVAGPDGKDMWNTNFQNGLPIGLVSQVGVSLGNYTDPDPAWRGSETERQNAIDGFLAFFHYSVLPSTPGETKAVNEAAMTNAIQAPYSPVASVVEHSTWQANDPLVHYMASDLNWAGANTFNRSTDTLTNENLGKLNQRYMPWGGNPLTPGSDANAHNLAVKDPLVLRSDDWDFPTYKLPTVGWLGRIHRGTPWQTVYLKSPDVLQEIQRNGSDVITYVGTNTWAQWTGDQDWVGNVTNKIYFDAANSAPVQDRLLFDLFTTAPDANATRGQLSVNVGASIPSSQSGLAAWSALFSGVQVLSNSVTDPLNQHNGSADNFISFPIEPAGPEGSNSAVGEIVAGINRLRLNADNSARVVSVTSGGTVTNEIPAHFANADGLAGAFEHVGDILSVPQLSDESPFLNWNNVTQLKGGISDEMYEWLPQQVMSLLRVSGTPQSPMRYVIYSYGQALKPAQGAIYTGGGPYFGMVTNYQVVAESATRTVVNFGSVLTNSFIITNDAFGSQIPVSIPVVTNNTAQIEQFNLLPPD